MSNLKLHQTAVSCRSWINMKLAVSFSVRHCTGGVWQLITEARSAIITTHIPMWLIRSEAHARITFYYYWFFTEDWLLLNVRRKNPARSFISSLLRRRQMQMAKGRERKPIKYDLIGLWARRTYENGKFLPPVVCARCGSAIKTV